MQATRVRVSLRARRTRRSGTGRARTGQGVGRRRRGRSGPGRLVACILTPPVNEFSRILEDRGLPARLAALDSTGFLIRPEPGTAVFTRSDTAGEFVWAAGVSGFPSPRT